MTTWWKFTKLVDDDFAVIITLLIVLKQLSECIIIWPLVDQQNTTYSYQKNRDLFIYLTIWNGYVFDTYYLYEIV